LGGLARCPKGFASQLSSLLAVRKDPNVLAYLACLAAGIALGVVLGARPLLRRLQQRFLPAAILGLLFFMGVGIGRDPDLPAKIGRFGWNALVVAVLAVAGSVAAVWGLDRLARRRP